MKRLYLFSDYVYSTCIPEGKNLTGVHAYSGICAVSRQYSTEDGMHV